MVLTGGVNKPNDTILDVMQDQREVGVITDDFTGTALCHPSRQNFGDNDDHMMHRRMFILSAGHVRGPQRKVSHSKHLSLEHFRRCLARVPTSVDIIFAGYSEPRLNPDCTEMVEHASAIGDGTRIFTMLGGMKERDLQRLQALRLRVFVVHVFDDGAYMDSRLVGDKFRDLVRQLVDADIPSIRFAVLGEAHPDFVDIIPAEA
ncbi:hypothetical protein NKI38_26130 [Mesorhizobium sp. M0621]|uniref:hypothetical protein n=1 Tax=Mesorhizobium sp. M0621 TaxID=2956974 RepID=UPI0033370A15